MFDYHPDYAFQEASKAADTYLAARANFTLEKLTHSARYAINVVVLCLENETAEAKMMIKLWGGVHCVRIPRPAGYRRRVDRYRMGHSLEPLGHRPRPLHYVLDDIRDTLPCTEMVIHWPQKRSHIRQGQGRGGTLPSHRWRTLYTVV